MKKLDEVLLELHPTIKDISIVKQKDDTELLYIIICESKDVCTKLVDIISVNHMKITVTSDKEDNHSFIFKFNEADGELIIPTKYTPDNYPPLKWITEHKGQRFITAGIHKGGGELLWDKRYTHLENI